MPPLLPRVFFWPPQALGLWPWAQNLGGPNSEFSIKAGFYKLSLSRLSNPGLHEEINRLSLLFADQWPPKHETRNHHGCTAVEPWPPACKGQAQHGGPPNARSDGMITQCASLDEI